MPSFEVKIIELNIFQLKIIELNIFQLKIIELVLESRRYRSSFANAEPLRGAIGLVQDSLKRAKAGKSNVVHPKVYWSSGVTAVERGSMNLKVMRYDGERSL